MKTMISAAAVAVALGLTAGPGLAQPSGGPDAKGNAPLKHPHTVNDGAAKHGHNSFTEGQARTHIEKAGFTGVSNLVKGDDGVWRGKAMRDGQTQDVAMDFKGNVSTSGGAAPARRQSAPGPELMAMSAPAPAATPAPSSSSDQNTTSASSASGMSVAHNRRHHHRRRHHRRHMHHGMSTCANPAPNGAACSGVDKNDNGISDKEDRAIHKGATP